MYSFEQASEFLGGYHSDILTSTPLDNYNLSILGNFIN